VQVKRRKAAQALPWSRRLRLTPDRVLLGLKKSLRHLQGASK